MATESDQSVNFLTSHSGFLGNTIEEKTRCILGWSPQPLKCPAGPLKKDRIRKTRTPPQNSAPYPYSLLSNEGRSRKNSSSVSSTSSQLITPPPSPASTSASASTSTNASVTIVSLPRTATTKMTISSHPKSDAYGCLPVSPVSPNTPNPCGNSRPRGKASSQVFDRIRELIPTIPADKNAYRVLLQTATSVIELEHKLENIIQEKEKYRSILENRRQRIYQNHPHSSSVNCRMASFGQTPAYPSNPVLGAAPTVANSSRKDSLQHNTTKNEGTGRPPSQWETNSSCNVPDDLLHVDVSAFKCLVTSPSGNDHSRASDKSSNQWEGFSGSFDFDFVVGNSNAIDTYS